jgi:phosphoribosylanthranilate isomerase
MTQVKICGITRLEDASHATQAGADMIGLNFYKAGPRYLSPEAAKALVDAIRGDFGEQAPLFVGIFVNVSADDIWWTMNRAGLDFAQLSGDESIDVLAALNGRAFKAIRPASPEMAQDDMQYYANATPNDTRVPSLLLDAHHPDFYGGTGQEAASDTILAIKAQVPRLMLAGGLTPDNVAARVSRYQPWGVDVASGVEADPPGIKDAQKISNFIKAAKG